MVEKSVSSGLWPQMFDPFRNFGSRVADWLAPASEASVKDDAYRIAVELPGVAEKDIDLTVENGMVTVKGEKKSSREEKGDTWYFSERQYGAFSRTFRLPADADENAVSADLKDGVLTVTVPKLAPEKGTGSKRVQISKG